MGERTVQANGIEIWTEDFGDPADPTILLIMGAGGQAILWPDEMCAALVEGGPEGGRHVIRYDNRDVGQTTSYADFSAHSYTVSDMAADAVGVLDAYDVERAHIVGASMGGMIAQTVALEHPDRVLTMTSIMSTPLAGSLIAAMTGAGAEGVLPGPEQKVLDVMGLMAEPPADDEARIDRGVQLWQALAGTMEPFDERAVREREKRILARAGNIDASQNHQFAVASSPDRTEQLGRVKAPTLVIHGTADPILPLPHGEATAAAIPGSKFLPIEGMGHELPDTAVPIVVGAILDHTK
jgi:pimeloyl-ACP methyl ester carboxylesterase